MNKEKVSTAKAMESTGAWSGPGEDEKFYNGTNPGTSNTGGALVVGVEDDWPRGVVKPRTLQTPTNDGQIDRTSYVENAYTPESVRTFAPITRLDQISTGSENEFRLLIVRTTERLHAELKKRMDEADGGYTTWEVAADMLEANRPVVERVSLQKLDQTIERHTQIVVRAVENETNEKGEKGKVIIVSARPNVDPEIGPPEDEYVDKMVTLLAQGGFLNIDNPAVLFWMAYTSHDMLDGLTADEIAEKIRSGDLEFARRGVIEFDASALHTHMKTNHQEPNPDFYAYYLNNEMGVLGPALGVTTFSGPFRNGTFARSHEMKSFVRRWFRTSGYQAAYHPMGSPEYLEETYKNITTGAASSLTRAGITGDKSHGETRVRTEKLRTAERLYGSAHPLTEVEASFVFSGAVNAAILSHYYDSGVNGILTEEAKQFFCNPNENRYNINRVQMGVHGMFANIINGHGEVQTYRDFIQDYCDFVQEQIQVLAIETNDYIDNNGNQINEINEYTNRLKRAAEIPIHGWSIANYMNPNHVDYAKGCLSTHLIAELVVRVKQDERWRYSYQNESGDWVNFDDYQSARSWWKSILSHLPEGRYDDEISEITNELSDLIHSRYN